MFVSSAAVLLNVRTEVAQVPVSILGNIFNTKFFPLKSAKVFGAKSAPIKLKSTAEVPTAGNSPIVLIGFPFNVILSFVFILKMNVFLCYN